MPCIWLYMLNVVWPYLCANDYKTRRFQIQDLPRSVIISRVMVSTEALLNWSVFFLTDSADSPDCLPILLTSEHISIFTCSFFPLFSFWLRAVD